MSTPGLPPDNKTDPPAVPEIPAVVVNERLFASQTSLLRRIEDLERRLDDLPSLSQIIERIEKIERRFRP